LPLFHFPIHGSLLSGFVGGGKVVGKCAYCDAEPDPHDGSVPLCAENATKSEKQVTKRRPTVSKSIQNILTDQIIKATSCVTEANQRFLEVVGQVPGDLTHEDGVQLIRNASRELLIAHEEMITAHKRLDNFIKHGIVPEDLKPTE
jgi:hypothetical protein